MKLSINIIIRELEKNYKFKQIKPISDFFDIGRPLFFSIGMTVMPNRVYVTDGAALEKYMGTVPVSALLLVCGKVKGALDAKCNVLEFEEGITPMMLFNDLQDLYEYYDRWAQSLRDLSDSGRSLVALLDATEEVLKNPLAIYTADFGIVAKSEGLKDDIDFSESHVPYELINSLKQDALYNSGRDYKRTYIYPGHITGYNSLCINIFRGKEFAYRAFVADKNQPIRPGDDAVLEYFGKFIQKMLTGNLLSVHMLHQDQHPNIIETLLSRIISDEKVDYSLIERSFETVNWSSQDRYCCITVKIATLDYQNHTVKLLCNQLENIVPYSCAFEIEGNIVLFANLSLADCDAEDIISKAIYFFRDNYLKAGVSDEFTGFMDMYYHHKQARIALDFVCRQYSYRWLLRFSDIALNNMIEQCMKELPLHVVCAKNVLNLKKYDEEHKTEFYRTLECYAQNHFNALQTSKAMFIHRSTFLYRMERIKELFGIDLDNDDSFLYTLLSMKMLEVAKYAKA